MSSERQPLKGKPRKKQPVSKEDIFGPEKTRDQVMEEIKGETEVFEKFKNSNFPHQKWDSHLEKSIL